MGAFALVLVAVSCVISAFRIHTLEKRIDKLVAAQAAHNANVRRRLDIIQALTGARFK